MKDSKNIVIGLLCAVVCIMAVAYAAFSTTLNINGTATIASNWNVAITGIECSAKAVEGGEAAAVTKSFTGTSATFNFTFNQPGDTGTCTVTVTNAGSLNAVVSNINVTATDGASSDTGLTDDAIQYEVSGIDNGTKLTANNGTNTYVINAEFVDALGGAAPTNAQKTKTLTVTIEYAQDLTA